MPDWLSTYLLASLALAATGVAISALIGRLETAGAVILMCLPFINLITLFYVALAIIQYTHQKDR